MGKLFIINEYPWILSTWCTLVMLARRVESETTTPVGALTSSPMVIAGSGKKMRAGGPVVDLN